MAKVGDLYSNLDLEYSGFLTGLKKSVDATAASAKSIEGSFDFIKRAAERVFAYEAIRTIKEFVTSSLEYAGSLGEVSQQLGVTSRDLQVYRYAAGQVGISQEEMDKGLQKFTKSLGEARAGSVATSAVFKELGFTDAEIKHLDVHDALLKTADGIAQVKDRANRAAPEVAIFGKAGQQLDTLLAGGSAQINALATAAEDLGLVLRQDQIENADKTADKLTELGTALKANFASVVADNTKSIYDFADSLEHLVAIIPELSRQLNILKTYFDEGEGRNYQAIGSVTDWIGEHTGVYLARPGLAASGKTETDAALAERARLQGGAPGAVGGDQSDQPGKAYVDPAAAAAAQRAREAAAKEAKRKADEAARNENRYQEDVARSNSDILGLQSDLTADYVERNKNAREQVDIEHDAAIKGIDLDTKLTASQKEVLKGLEDRKQYLEHDRINREENIEVEQDELATAQARLANARDLLSEMQNMARTAAERREIELRLLANARDQEENGLAPILADADRPVSQRRYTDAQITQAQDRYASLDAIYGAKADSIRKSTQGPGESYLDGLIQSAGEANEALQSVEVDGLKGLEDGIAGAISGTEKLGDVFKNVSAQIIADIAKIAIERSVIEPLANTLFGGAGVSSQSYWSGVAADSSFGAPEIPTLGFATGGGFEVGGSGGPDSQLFGLKLSPGEAVNVTHGGGDGGRRGGMHFEQHLHITGGTDLVRRSDLVPVAAATRTAALQAMTDLDSRK